MNKDKAIESFLVQVEHLSRLPFITDLEMDALFGEEMAEALGKLDRFNQTAGVCSACSNRCCHTSDCELYAPQLPRCPVHDLRPVVCRLHFCHRFQDSHGPLIVELTDIFFDSLIAAEAQASPTARLFDCPPLTRTAPEFVTAVSPWMKAIQQGTLTPEHATRLIRQKAGEFRSTLIRDCSR